jgi:hypothetical protein
MGKEMRSAMITRKDKRFTKILKVKIDIKGKHVWGVLQNLSLNGLYFKTNCSLEKGNAITIELCLPNGVKSNVKGLVRRIEVYTEGNWHFGIGTELIANDFNYRCYIQQLTEQN